MSGKKLIFLLTMSVYVFALPLRSLAQVNLQTGSAVFSIPMLSWQDDKSSLKTMVSLNYNSGNGLKVNDVASNEGQGWGLTAGGVITRLQAGEPDDQPAYAGAYPSYGDRDITRYPAGYLYNTGSVGNGCPNALTKYPIYGGQNEVYAQKNVTGQDLQMDYFSFQFNGRSGLFVIDTVGGWHGVPLGDTKMQIALQLDPTMTSQGIRTTITSFTITDVDGLVYKFTLHGLTRLLKAIYSSGDGSKIAGAPKISNGGVYCQSAFDLGPTASPWINTNMAYPYIISNWYLSEIDDPFTSRKITFTYNTSSLSNSVGYDFNYTASTDNFMTISYKKSMTTTLDIASITCPDGHTVNFNYSSASRYDYPGEHALSSVSVMYEGRYISQYQLNTTYFILDRYGNPTTAYQQSVARLCLRSVKRIAVDLKEDEQPYQFDYYTTSGTGTSDDVVPPPFTYAKDIWGYYNGNNSVAYDGTAINLTYTIPYANLNFNQLKGLCFQSSTVTGTNYNAKPQYAENGLLKEIVYPTGGSITYFYAQNTGAFLATPSTTRTLGGVHVDSTSNSDGGYSNACSNAMVTRYNYVMNGPGSASSLWGVETPVTSVVSNNSWEEEHDTWHFSWSNPTGECLWHFVYPGILSQYEAISLEGFQKFMTAIGPALGILSIACTVMDIINVINAASTLTVVGIILDVISAVVTYVITCQQKSKYTAATIYYNFDLNQAAPLPAQFKRVEVTQSPGTIGKTVVQFTYGDPNDPRATANPPDPNYYPLWFTDGSNTALSAKQRFAPWAYGLPTYTDVYDVNGNLIRETQNVYDWSYVQEGVLSLPLCPCVKYDPPVLSCKCQVINNYSERSDWWGSDAPSYLAQTSPDMLVDFYSFYTGRVNLDSTYERVYRTTDPTQYVQSETNYTYNTGGACNPVISCTAGPQGNYEVNQITTRQSNGDVNYKNIYYTTDFNTGILATMVSKNVVALPISSVTSVKKANQTSVNYITEKVTEYTQITDNEIKPYRTLEQRFAAPVSSITRYSGPTTTNYSNYAIPQSWTYDANSNIAVGQDEGGRDISYIYDYLDKYVVATIVNCNAPVDHPAYTSFENSDMTRSGWTITGTPMYNYNVTSPTGNDNFTLLSSGGNSLTTTSSLNTGAAYILSFWASNSNVTVTGGATLTKSAPAYNGFTYYEYNIVAGTTSVVLKNNTTTNVSIDEVRLYPSYSKMRTLTYDPLIGKTSECDENNRITYYTYDNLDRMQLVADETHNIVKMYEFNTVSPAKATGCPASFSNHAISEQALRSNCGAGYQGGAVTYSVPAAQFTSTISQQDADIQAEIYILTNEFNYANSNGACSLIYYNVVESQTDTSQSCAEGYKGGLVTYTVPAGTYSSIISQADANQQALNDIAANAQQYVNSPVNQVCNIDTAADWEYNPGDGETPADPSYCLSVNGQLPPHFFIFATDLNPNSPTYGHQQWWDDGPNSACPANYYYNAQMSQAFTRNNCSAGYVGSSVTYTVPPGKYSSTTSQAAANQLATNDINANGQNYANTNGTCTQFGTITYNDERTFQYSVRFTNNSTQAVYNYTSNASSSGTFGQIPVGTYTVYICPINNYTNNNNYNVLGTAQTSVVCATFNNVSVTASGGNIIFY